MKAPAYGGNDYDWATEQSFLIKHQVFKSDNPNKYILSLQDCDRRLYYVMSGVTAVMNGGLDGYLNGTHGDESEGLLESLNYIKAFEMAKTIASMQDLFQDSKIPEDYSARMDCRDAIVSLHGVRRIDEIVNIVIDDNIWALIRKLDNSK